MSNQIVINIQGFNVEFCSQQRVKYGREEWVVVAELKDYDSISLCEAATLEKCIERATEFLRKNSELITSSPGVKEAHEAIEKHLNQ